MKGNTCDLSAAYFFLAPTRGRGLEVRGHFYITPHPDLLPQGEKELLIHMYWG